MGTWVVTQTNKRYTPEIFADFEPKVMRRCGSKVQDDVPFPGGQMFRLFSRIFFQGCIGDLS